MVGLEQRFEGREAGGEELTCRVLNPLGEPLEALPKIIVDRENRRFVVDGEIKLFEKKKVGWAVFVRILDGGKDGVSNSDIEEAAKGANSWNPASVLLGSLRIQLGETSKDPKVLLSLGEKGERKHYIRGRVREGIVERNEETSSDGVIFDGEVKERPTNGVTVVNLSEAEETFKGNTPYQEPKFDDTTPEKDLVAHAIQGDKEAFTGIYDRYYERVYRHVLYRIPSAEDAEDISQLAFMRAWIAIGRYKQTDAPFISWLLTIAHNLTMNFYRRSHPTIPLEISDREDETKVWKEYTDDDIHVNPEGEILLLEDRERVRKALEQLRPEYRQVLSMRFLDNLPYSSVALALGKGEINVGVIQHRALRELRRILGLENKD